MKFISSVLMLFAATVCQAQNGCPAGWFPSDGKCVKAWSGPPLIQESLESQESGLKIAQKGKLTCSADQLVPNSSSDDDYIRKCFVLDVSLTLDLDQNLFSLYGEYDRNTCGGWPPVLEPVIGKFLSQADGTATLSSDGYTAHLTLTGNSATGEIAHYEGPEGTYVLQCTRQTTAIPPSI
jgi:hypothetical protein